MRIVGTDKLQGVYGKQAVKRVEAKTNSSQGHDSVSFSTFAREMKLATKAVKDAPDVRIDKVNQIKAQIEAGKYNVTANQIAEKILGF